MAISKPFKANMTQLYGNWIHFAPITDMSGQGGIGRPTIKCDLEAYTLSDSCVKATLLFSLSKD